MKKIIWLLFALLLSTSVRASNTCLPTPDTFKVSTSAGSAWSWWCMIPTHVTEAPDSFAQTMQTWVCLTKYCSKDAFTAAIVRIMTADDMNAQYLIERTNSTVKPAVGSLDEYNFNNLQHLACAALITPLFTQNSNGASITSDDVDDFCGKAPTLPVIVPPTEFWRVPVTSKGIEYNVTGEARTSQVVGQSAAPNTLCDCTNSISAAGLTYCPLNGGNQLIVTWCQKASK